MSIATKADPTDNLSGALIGYNNLLIDSTFTLGELALTPFTYERFTNPPGSKNIKYQFATSTAIDFIAIAAHNLSGESFALRYATTIGGALTTIVDLTPSDNTAIMENFEPITMAEISISGTFSGNIEIGVVSSGVALQMPRNIYGGHSPITLSQVTEYQSTNSESGQFLGRTIIRKGLETNFSWQLLDDAFIRGAFKLFSDSARTLPFFIKWRPDFYSDEVAYCSVENDIIPTNMGGGHRLMSVSFSAKGHADV